MFENDQKISSQLYRKFKLCDGDDFTKNFLKKLGVKVGEACPVPNDPYSTLREEVNNPKFYHLTSKSLISSSKPRLLSLFVLMRRWIL